MALAPEIILAESIKPFTCRRVYNTTTHFFTLIFQMHVSELQTQKKEAGTIVCLPHVYSSTLHKGTLISSALQAPTLFPCSQDPERNEPHSQLVQ